MPKIRMTPDASTGCHDFRFEPASKSDWKVCEAYISLLKGTIPASDRLYNPQTKTWSVLDKYVEGLKKLADTIGVDVIVAAPVSADGFFYEHAINSPSVETKDTLALKLITILGISEETLKDSVATKKAYRSKALLLHPDRNNGDGSKMSELNSIWSAYNAS